MPSNLMSRSQFLKLMMSSAIVAGVGVVGMSSLFRGEKRKARAQAPNLGSWSPSSDTLDVGIHAALLKDGKVFYLAGSANHAIQADGPFLHFVWDPVTDTHVQLPTLSEDLFCVGLATLANGNILLAGGTLEYDHQAFGRFLGLKAAYEVDFNTGNIDIARRTEMAHGRWYPTCVELPDGKVLTVLGYDEYGCRNNLAEIYDPVAKSWAKNFDPNTSLTYCVGGCAEGQDANFDGQIDFPTAGQPCYGGPNQGTVPSLSLYPRMHLLPSGLVCVVGQAGTDRLYDPSTSRWYFAAGGIMERAYGTSVLCPLQNIPTEKGKILICGGSNGPAGPTTNSVQIADPHTPPRIGLTRRNVPSMTYARKHQNPVILPTGDIVIFGGNSVLNQDSSAVLTPEMFNPVSETWSTLPPHTVHRLYHGIALLLMDGRVWTAGTTLNKSHKEKRTEIFSPWYVSEPRPTIVGNPTGGDYGGTITISTPESAAVTKVSLLKQSGVTHHYNTDQRLIWLQIVNQSVPGSITVSAPINNKLAPPGMYLVHVLNNAGVPSIGKFIQIPPITSIYQVTGNNSYLKLYTGSLKRAGEIITTTSVLKGKSVKKVSVVLKKSGNPTGTISVVVRKASGDAVVLTFGTIAASSVTTSDQTFTLTAPSSRILATNDKVLVEWAGTGTSTNQVWVKRFVGTGGFDGANTKSSWYGNNNLYSSQADSDLAGEWF
jgi:hypothetical protein